MRKNNAFRGRGCKRPGQRPRKRRCHETKDDATPSKRPHNDPHESFFAAAPVPAELGPTAEQRQEGPNTRSSCRLVQLRDIDNPDRDETQRDLEALDAWCHVSKPSDLRVKLSVRHDAGEVGSSEPDLRRKLPPRGQRPRGGNVGRRPGDSGASNDDKTVSYDLAIPSTSHAAPQPVSNTASVHSALPIAHDLHSKLLGRRKPEQYSSCIIDSSSMTIQVFTNTPEPPISQKPAPDHERGRESGRQDRSSRHEEGIRELGKDDTNITEKSDNREGRHDRSDRNLRKDNSTEFTEHNGYRKVGDECSRRSREHRDVRDDYSRASRESSCRESRDKSNRRDSTPRELTEHSTDSNNRESRKDNRQFKDNIQFRENSTDQGPQGGRYEGKRRETLNGGRGFGIRDRGDRSQGRHFPANDRNGKGLASGASHEEDIRQTAENRDMTRSKRHWHAGYINMEHSARDLKGIRQQAAPTRRGRIRETMSRKKQNQPRTQTHNISGERSLQDVAQRYQTVGEVLGTNWQHPSRTRNRKPRSRERSQNTHDAPESESQEDEKPVQTRQTFRGKIDYKEFLRRIRTDFTKSSADDADGICVFLARNDDHVARLTRDEHDRDTSDKLVELLRTALIESENCVNIRSQIMQALTKTRFFESRLVNDLLKSLVPTRQRMPDEDDVRPMNHVLDILKVITRYRQMSHVDVKFFLNNLKGVLSQAATAGAVQVTGSTDANKILFDSIYVIEEHIQETERITAQRDELKTDQAPSTSLDLPAIIPKVTDIHRYRKVKIDPRKVVDVFSTASEYVRYTFLVFRQDFIGPLCKAIQRYREYVRNADRQSRARNQVQSNLKQRFKNQSVRLYENVEVVDTALSLDTDVDLMIKIDPSRIKYFNSRLKFGSLVCLSDNDFMSVIFATVKDKNVKQLKEEGLLTVHVVEQENGDFEGFDETFRRESQFGRKEGETGEDRVGGARAYKRPGPHQQADGVRRHTLDVEELRGRTFTMLESTAFYTSYRHPLEALAGMHRKLAVRQSSLPFKKQLLELSKNLASPRYLQAGDGLMSFECMKKYVTTTEIGNKERGFTQGTVFRDEKPKKDGSRTTQGSCDSITSIVGNMSTGKRVTTSSAITSGATTSSAITSGATTSSATTSGATSPRKEQYKAVNVQKPETWPSAKELGLDNSQYAALQQALTKELALIQGPPGTGKTTIGVRIAEVLLENEHLWRKNDMLDPTPLLLISYTNHALDQFLAELLALPVMREHGTFRARPRGSACNDVVRVGSRSENEEFARHNLTSLRKTYYDGDGFGYQQAYKNDQKRLQDLRTNREHINLEIKRYVEGIVHENTLRNKRVILTEHFRSLQSGHSGGEMAAIVRWLNLHKKDCGERSEGTMQFAQQQRVSGFQNQSSSSYTQLTQDNRGGMTKHYGDSPGRLADLSHAREDEDLELEETDTDEDDVDYYDTENEEDELRHGNTNEQYARTSSPSDEGHIRPGSPFNSDYSSSEMAVKLSFILAQKSLWASQDHNFGGIPSDSCGAAQQKIRKEVVKNDVMTDLEESSITDIWQLDVTQRWRLYRLWLSRVTATIRNLRQKEEAEFQKVSDRVVEQRNLVDKLIMQRARIVAMTTTGASRMTSVLGSLGPRIVIVEEAAQVSEAHLLSSLSAKCEHLILIGDHQQLRPSYNDYSLTAHRGQHHVDISLFERLCRGGVPYRRLDLQHRMRPEISSLLVPTIYDHLTDHDDVKKYPNVRGVTSNVFFLGHQQPEDTPEDSKSKRNTHEASFLAALYRYLRLQGYREKDITILATYKAQEALLRKLIQKVETEDPIIPKTSHFVPLTCSYRGKAPSMPKHQGARVTAVDNFQGEENKVILLSLVRSNAEGKIGFLKEENRVCVALSRAKEGLFVIGNLSMLEGNSPNCWKPILDAAKGKQQLGSALRLRCPRHKNQFTDVSCEDDFKQRCPNGGCFLSCDYRRPCGHACDQMCHDAHLFHWNPCPKPCARKCPFQHACVDHPCSDKCPPCPEKIKMKMEPCGHTMELKCGQRLMPPPCQVQCEKTLACSHRCQARCGEKCTAQCKELVKVRSVCGHEFQIACWAAEDTDGCTVPCNTTLQCGHLCPGKCGQCFAGRLHQPCRKKCDRTLVCGHACREDCTMSCPPCKKPCRAKCTHSKCREQCGDSCTPCVEKCAWACKRTCKNRYRCTKLCSELCDRPRCDTPCESKHRCGQCKRFYRCRGLLCEKDCPQACPRCNADIFTILFGNEDEPDARFYKLPDCGCVLELSFLDGWMDMANTDEEEGRPMAVLEKKCPKCKSDVFTAQRYGNVLKRAYADVMAVKTKIQVMSPLASMEAKRLTLQRRTHTDVEFRVLERAVSSARTLDDLSKIENQLNFLRAILDLKNALLVQRLSTTGASDTPVTKASRHLDKLQEWTKLKRRSFSDQECVEFRRELTRADLTVLFAISLTTMMRQGQDGSDAFKKNERWFLRLVNETGVLLPKEETDMRRIVGLSAAERLMVVKAMGFQPGHWYKCPNGHVYAIGECGGAMQRSRCPECHADIGGSNHALSAGNAVATEMDGSRHAAWSDQANLANYGDLQ